MILPTNEAPGWTTLQDVFWCCQFHIVVPSGLCRLLGSSNLATRFEKRIHLATCASHLIRESSIKLCSFKSSKFWIQQADYHMRDKTNFHRTMNGLGIIFHIRIIGRYLYCFPCRLLSFLSVLHCYPCRMWRTRMDPTGLCSINEEPLPPDSENTGWPDC